MSLASSHSRRIVRLVRYPDALPSIEKSGIKAAVVGVFQDILRRAMHVAIGAGALMQPGHPPTEHRHPVFSAEARPRLCDVPHGYSLLNAHLVIDVQREGGYGEKVECVIVGQPKNGVSSIKIGNRTFRITNMHPNGVEHGSDLVLEVTMDGGDVRIHAQVADVLIPREDIEHIVGELHRSTPSLSYRTITVCFRLSDPFLAAIVRKNTHDIEFLEITTPPQPRQNEQRALAE